MNSFTEENYLKAIFKLFERSKGEPISTNAIAEAMNTKAATVTDMLKKLSRKKLINYRKYKGVTLSEKGKEVAISIIRKHRLWEYFLVNELHFNWDEVHDIAEQLEHIQSDDLVERLDSFLNHPKVDPHGDPIPDKNGEFHTKNSSPLSSCEMNDKVIMTGVIDHSPEFLQYLDNLGISLGDELQIENIIEYDRSIELKHKKKKLQISNEVARNILVI